MKTSPVNEFFDWLFNLFRRIPVADRRNTCLDDISTDLVEIRQLLAAKVPDRTICETINFCSLLDATPTHNDALIVGKPRVAVTDRDYCTDCHNFFEDAKELYIGNYTEDEFKQMLLDQCDQAGYPAITELCKTVIEQYWPQIYARLQMFFDPDEVCYQLNFCNSSMAMNPKWHLPLVPRTAARSKNPSNNPVSITNIDRNQERHVRFYCPNLKILVGAKTSLSAAEHRPKYLVFTFIDILSSHGIADHQLILAIFRTFFSLLDQQTDFG